ncbi:MAG: hypothetical protein J6S50_10035 [Oscillospiraceae bacterium]|nr:hypothetical protein [Oscillospiraceae bacterium]
MERLYEISHIKEKQFNWSNIPEIPIDNVLWEPGCGVRAFARLCYDDEALYVSLRAVEAHIRAEYTVPLSPVHRDSCLEFFFMPERGERYFNFEVNPNGCMHIGFGHNRADRVILARRDDMEFFCIKPERTPNGWAVSYRVPLSFLQLFYPDFSFSGLLRANAYKCGDDTAHPHYLSWNPVTSTQPDFHRPEDFGIMKFE